jgi:hypothetical protein
MVNPLPLFLKLTKFCENKIKANLKTDRLTKVSDCACIKQFIAIKLRVPDLHQVKVEYVYKPRSNMVSKWLFKLVYCLVKVHEVFE